MIDFPASPTLGQQFTAAGVTWTWDGVKWGPSSAAGVLIAIGDAPPASPTNGALWWDSVSGQLFVFYNDGTSSQWVPTTNQIGNGGVTDGSNAAAGVVGEVISALFLTAISIPAATQTNIGSIALSPGDWDVQGEAWLTLASGATAAVIQGCISPSAAFLTAPALNYSRCTIFAAITPSINVLSLAPCRFSLSAPATAYLVGYVGLTAGTCTGTGRLWARRAR